MFFVGLSKTPYPQFPRYDFFYIDSLGEISTIIQKILSSICYSSIEIDKDHSLMSDEPIAYLIPTVTQQAHYYSKNFGKYISEDTASRIMSEYKTLLSQIV